MKRTQQQNKVLHRLLSRLGISDESKADMVLSFTNGRTERSSEMTMGECQNMIVELEHLLDKSKTRENELKQTLRRNVFKLMYDLGYLNGNMSNTEKLSVINRWAADMLHYDKDLNYLSIDELRRFINQLQAIRRNKNKQKKKAVMYN